MNNIVTKENEKQQTTITTTTIISNPTADIVAQRQHKNHPRELSWKTLGQQRAITLHNKSQKDVEARNLLCSIFQWIFEYSY